MPNDDADMSAVGSRRGAIDAELLYPRLERGALEAQAGGGPLRTSEHPVGLAQRPENGVALRRFERGSGAGRRERATPELRHGYAKGGPVRQDDGALDRVLELPHVSRPGIARERRHGVGGDGLDALVHATRELLHEVSDERRNVLWPLAERWKRDREDVQAIVQIVPERAGGDHLFEVPVRGCDYSDVDALRTRATEPLELPLLEHPQQLRLQLERDVADLVEEERSAVGQLETADPLRDGPGESAALVAEELALEQPRRDGGAVDLDERPPSAPAQVVKGAGDQLLAGARLAADEHGRVGRRDRLRLVQHAFQRRGLTDDVLEVVLGADLVLEVDLLRGELVLELGDLLERERVLDREGDLARSGGQELRVAIGERLGAEPADAERPQPAVVHRERHTAHRLDAFGEQGAPDIGHERREIRTPEPRGLSRRERLARGRPLHRDEHVLLDQPLAGELERPHVERVALAVVDGEARVVVRHHASQAGRDLAEQRARNAFDMWALEFAGKGLIKEHM